MSALTTETLSEVHLLDGMVSHDAAAWREFCRRYDHVIWRCINKVTARFTSVLSLDDANEVYASFLLGLMSNDMHKLRMFNPDKGNRLATWVGLLAINSAWDFLRSVARQPIGDPLTLAEDRPSLSPDPFEHVARREDCTRVEGLLRSFSRRDRRFVTLYFVDGRSPEEVADEMGISVKTVYSKKHKIRSRLEKLLIEKGISLAA